jgi:hypothetical protein
VSSWVCEGCCIGCGWVVVGVLVRVASILGLLLRVLQVLKEASDLLVAATVLPHAAAAGRKARCGAHGSRAGI